MTIRIIALSCVAAFLCLPACGQSGPLYLPGNPNRVQVESPEEDAGEVPDADAEADAEPDARD